MADQFWKGVCFRRLERFGLDNQVIVTGAARRRNQVDADCRRRGRVIRRGKLVDNRLHAGGRVLRDLSYFGVFRRDDVADSNCHNKNLLLNRTGAGKVYQSARVRHAAGKEHTC